MMRLCPMCHRDLEEVERMGVLVDICPHCQGIWLDRGELEKVSEYIRTMMASPNDQTEPSARFVTVYETSVRRGMDDPHPSKKFQFRNLLDIFR